MNDEETVALIAGGHTFGKTHGAASPDLLVGSEPEGALLEAQALASLVAGSGKGRDAITSGIEVTWTQTPTRWSNNLFEPFVTRDGLTQQPARPPVDAQWWVLSRLTADCGRRDKRGSRGRFDADDRPASARRAWYEQISRRFLSGDRRSSRTLSREPVCQADSPRHGADSALPGPARTGRDAYWRTACLRRPRAMLTASRRWRGSADRATGLSAAHPPRGSWGRRAAGQRQAGRRQWCLGSASIAKMGWDNDPAGAGASPFPGRTLEGVQAAFAGRSRRRPDRAGRWRSRAGFGAPVEVTVRRHPRH